MPIFDDIKKIKGSVRDLRNFGFLVGGIFLGLGLLFFYFGKSSWIAMAEGGIILLIFGFIYPRVLGPIYKAWMIFGTVIGFIITNVILTIFFYFIVTSLAIIFRLFGKRFLNLGFRTKEKSYWNERSQEKLSDDLEKQF